MFAVPRVQGVAETYESSAVVLRLGELRLRQVPTLTLLAARMTMELSAKKHAWPPGAKLDPPPFPAQNAVEKQDTRRERERA